MFWAININAGTDARPTRQLDWKNSYVSYQTNYGTTRLAMLFTPIKLMHSTTFDVLWLCLIKLLAVFQAVNDALNLFRFTQVSQSGSVAF